MCAILVTQAEVGIESSWWQTAALFVYYHTGPPTSPAHNGLDQSKFAMNAPVGSRISVTTNSSVAHVYQTKQLLVCCVWGRKWSGEKAVHWRCSQGLTNIILIICKARWVWSLLRASSTSGFTQMIVMDKDRGWSVWCLKASPTLAISYRVQLWDLKVLKAAVQRLFKWSCFIRLMQ